MRRKLRFKVQKLIEAVKTLWEHTDLKIRNKAQISCLDRLDGIEVWPFPFADGPRSMKWENGMKSSCITWRRPRPTVVLQRLTCEEENKQREKVVVWKIVDWRNYRDRRLFISKLRARTLLRTFIRWRKNLKCVFARRFNRLLKDIKACLWSQTLKTKGRCLRFTLNIHFLFSKQRKLELVSDKNLVRNVNVSLSCLHEAIKV